MLKYRIIAVDIDGTLGDSEYSYPYLEDINTKAIYVLNKYRAKGGKIILWTLRSDDHLDLALDALKRNQLHWDAVNENIPERILEWDEKYPGMNLSPKVYYDLCIDDRNYGTHKNGLNWDDIEKEILSEK